MTKSSKEQPSGANASARKPIPFSPLPVNTYEAAIPVIPASDCGLPYLPGTPRLSVILIVYKMPRQAMNTLVSLTAGYQRGVTAEDYEVIVLENASSQMLCADEVHALAPNFRYFARQEKEPTPVHAVSYGASVARANMIAVMIDGARMLTPGAVAMAIAAQRLSQHVVVAVPGYHLGEKLQQEAMLQGYDEQAEKALLGSIAWPGDGYRLFDISCLSGTSIGGYFRPMGESNFICVSREVWQRVGGFDPLFDQTGGGQVNLDFYKRVCELPETILIVLAGEGSFHQFHGGITTGQQGDVRRQIMTDHFAQYAAIRGGAYRPPEKRAILFGAFPDNTMKTAEFAARNVRAARGELADQASG